MDQLITNFDLNYNITQDTFMAMQNLVSKVLENIIKNDKEIGLTDQTPKDYLVSIYSAMCSGLYMSEESDQPRESKPQFVADDMEAIAKRLKEIQKEREHGVNVVPPSDQTYAPASIY